MNVTDDDDDVILDMEDECFPAMSMNQACGRLSECVSIKDEPMSESDNSPHSSCPSSPQSIIINPADMSFEVNITHTLYQFIHST